MPTSTRQPKAGSTEDLTQFDAAYFPHTEVLKKYVRVARAPDGRAVVRMPEPIFAHLMSFLLGAVGFEEEAYLDLYEDVLTGVRSGAIKSGVQHFIQHGFWEGRTINLRFSESYYTSENSDVAEAIEAGEIESAREHWDRFGHAEGRPGSAETAKSAELWRSIFAQCE